jgi:hypothetical protein
MNWVLLSSSAKASTTFLTQSRAIYFVRLYTKLNITIVILFTWYASFHFISDKYSLYIYAINKEVAILISVVCILISLFFSKYGVAASAI